MVFVRCLGISVITGIVEVDGFFLFFSGFGFLRWFGVSVVGMVVCFFFFVCWSFSLFFFSLVVSGLVLVGVLEVDRVVRLVALLEGAIVKFFCSFFRVTWYVFYRDLQVGFYFSRLAEKSFVPTLRSL